MTTATEAIREAWNATRAPLGVIKGFTVAFGADCDDRNVIAWRAL